MSGQGEYDRELIARMLEMEPGTYTSEAITEQIRLLRAADNASQARTVNRSEQQPAGVTDAMPMLRECYEWLFDSMADGPRVSEGALDNGAYTPAFRDLHDRLKATITAAGRGGEGLHRCDMCGVVATPDPAVGCVRCGWDEMRPITAGDVLFTADTMLKYGEQQVRKAAPQQPPPVSSCGWSQQDDMGDSWDTGCGHLFMLNEGTPSENSMTHCCFCGAPVAEHRWTEDET